MKEYVAKRSRQSVAKNDIISINGAAVKEQKKGISVVNASIGMMLDADKSLSSVALIQDALKNHICDDLSYCSSIGNERYLEGVKKFVFRDALKDLEEKYSIFTGATLGGTGAVAATFTLFLEREETVLLPDVMWSNYMLVATKAGANYRKYSLFDKDGKFNIEALKDEIEKGFETSQRLVVVINDPCQNPTGYCMSDEEYTKTFDMLDEEAKKGYLTVLFDVAYMRFHKPENGKYALIETLKEKKHDFLPVIAFSTSKVFGLYGLRLGALIALCHNEENRLALGRAFTAFARSTYSVPVGAAQEAVADVLLDETKTEELDAQIDKLVVELQRRGNTMARELARAGIDTYPYTSGFFLTIRIDHAVEIYEEMKKQHIYIVPLDDHQIRIALSGITEEEAIRIVDGFKKLKL